MNRTTISTLFLLLLTAAVVAEGFDFAGERAKANNWLADGHADLGKDYAKVGMNVAAWAQYERALVLVPEHADSMRGLGNKKVDGRWVSDKPLPKADAAGVKIDDGTKVDKARDKFYEKAAERLRKLATSAENAGLANDAALTWSELLFYAPKDAAANAKLGLKPDGRGGFAAPFVIAARERGKKVLDEAGDGAESAPDPQGEGIGAKLYVRKGGAVVGRATESDKRAARIHKVGEGASVLAHEILGASGLVTERSPYTLTSLKERAQYVAMIEKYTDLKGADKELSLRLSGTQQAKPWGFFVLESHPDSADDTLANTMALVVMYYYRGAALSDPWIETGFSYLVTGRLLGTTLCVRYVIDEAVTSAKKPAAPDARNDLRSPEGQRARVANAVRLGKDIPLRVLAATELNDMKADHASKSLSLFEFFFERYREQTLKWLATKPASKAKELEQCCAALGKTAEEIDAEWRRWVLMNY